MGDTEIEKELGEKRHTREEMEEEKRKEERRLEVKGNWEKKYGGRGR